MREFSVREAAKEFGVSPQVLGKRLRSHGTNIGRGKKVTIKQCHEALAKVANMRQATDEARLRNLEEDALLKELQRKEKERELVPLDEALDLVSGLITPLSRLIKDMPARLAVSCNPEDHVLAREVLREYAGDLLDKVNKACTSKSKKLS